MQWFYSEHGQQKGPVSPEQLGELTRSGVVTPQTLVWREGFANWIAYSAIPQAAPPSETTAPQPHGELRVCSECGLGFPRNETIELDGSIVCSNCKPIAMQKIREGVTPGAGIWRSGRRLVTLVDATLPPRCLKCNAPTDTKPIRRNLYWHPPAIYFALLSCVVLYVFGLLLYIILGIATRKRGVVLISICQPHRSARNMVILISWLLTVGGFVAGITGIVQQSEWIGGLGGIAFLGGMIYGLARGRLIVVQRMDQEHMWLGGCGPEFLAGFPEWTGPRF